jgi:DNA ligase (NAD+)
VLYALGIRYAGETVAKKLAFHFGNIDNIIRAGFEELKEVEEIGEKIAESVVNFFSDPVNIAIIDRLKHYGISFQLERSAQKVVVDKLGGKIFVISGIFRKFSREQIKEMIEKYGGKSTGSISARTDFLLAGENMGPAKMKKAQDLGVKVISEEEFLAMIG